MRKIYILVLCLSFFCPLWTAELPRPSYDNSLVFAFAYYLRTATTTEVNYLKSVFGDGLYAPLTFTNFAAVPLDWHSNPINANTGIKSFKDTMDSYVAKAKSYGVGLHIILNFGISRNANYYKAAKEEDIRNAQWYTDNNLAALDQLNRTSQMEEMEDPPLFSDPANQSHESLAGTYAGGMNINEYVYGTHSRYARKLRAHLEAKVRAAMNVLQKKQAENPDVLLIVSAPGEAELNALRLDHSEPLQDFVCDYSPFAILEFRDWITHEGLYAPAGKYAGQGYVNGGSRYQGEQGLNHFNTNFDTTFTTWNLKYYDWSLEDEVDSNYTDTVNPDPHIIPLTNYTYDGMKPTTGPNYISGGFDPPRVVKQKGEDAFWDLWNLFRETMVYHYVKDIATIARESGIAKDRYYTHQIPADYLFGTSPNEPTIPYLNPRYYGSASPLWTAAVYADMGLGVTMYDINFGTWYARTTAYILPELTALATNWGALEYNPEILVDGVTIASTESIYQQIKRLYDANAHVVSFYKWVENNGSHFKGTNRELAAKQFFENIKDKARQSVDTIFSPPPVNTFKGTYTSAYATVNLSWSPKIWSDLNHNWSSWGDFKEFIIYRGNQSGFVPQIGTQIARLTGTSFQDKGPFNGGTVYYKVFAVNHNNQVGPQTSIAVNVGGSGGTPVLTVSVSAMTFVALTGRTAPLTQSFTISNSGTGILNWSVVEDSPWITCTPGSGSNEGVVAVTIDPTGKTTGSYTGTITVNAPGTATPTHPITLTLIIQPAGQDEPPFGYFDSPLDYTTVQGSIPVTGWALDDIGIQSIRLYRESPDGLLWVGDALQVEGARPDVVRAFPDFPNNTKAGWGYMLLTHFLPNGGNGTVVLHAIAMDETGHEVTLGTRTIYCDNAHAQKPFGAIDTPTQGGVATGSAFVNFGWVLTPQPNSIPTNGSTLSVYIDGVNVGRPVYNNYRSDIATLFPAYANSQGAVGYFYINTKNYSNGVHTISWMARDSAGNEDGVGSRYFTIQNAAGSATANQPASYRGNSTTSTRRVEIAELERLEIRLFPGGTNRVTNLSPLPVGSTLDTKRGIFYWQPGPGFIGEYTFDFIQQKANGLILKKTLHVYIFPKGQKESKKK